MNEDQNKILYITDQFQSVSPSFDTQELIMRRRNLPHWELGGATYFITFHLAGSIPLSVINRIRVENETKINQKTAQLGKMSLEQRNELKFEMLLRIDDYLDSNKNIRYLANPQIANLVQDALLYFAVLYVPDLQAYKNSTKLKVFDGKNNESADIVPRFILFNWVIMPNHVHILIQPLVNPKTGKYFQLEKILHSIKSYTSTEANKMLGKQGLFWQHESYDHIIRSEEEFYRIWKYINYNPVKAGLCDKGDGWKWGSGYFMKGF